MCASVWFELFGGLFSCQTPWYMRGKCDNKKGGLNWAHLFPKVSGYKRGSDITEVSVSPIIVVHHDFLESSLISKLRISLGCINFQPIHPSIHPTKNYNPYRLVASSSWINRLDLEFLKLLLVSKLPKIITFKIHTISWLLCWMNERYVHMQ